MPLRIFRASQAPVRADGECGDVGMPHMDLIEQAQGGVVLTVFERQQSAVNRRECFGVLRERAPRSIDQAYRRRHGIMLQCEANSLKTTGERAVGTAPKSMVQSLERRGEHECSGMNTPVRCDRSVSGYGWHCLFCAMCQRVQRLR
jgi:hypothetical protein